MRPTWFHRIRNTYSINRFFLRFYTISNFAVEYVSKAKFRIQFINYQSLSKTKHSEKHKKKRKAIRRKQ